MELPNIRDSPPYKAVPEGVTNCVLCKRLHYGCVCHSSGKAVKVGLQLQGDPSQPGNWSGGPKWDYVGRGKLVYGEGRLGVSSLDLVRGWDLQMELCSVMTKD